MATYNPRPLFFRDAAIDMEAHQLRNEVTALQARFDALRGYL